MQQLEDGLWYVGYFMPYDQDGTRTIIGVEDTELKALRSAICNLARWQIQLTCRVYSAIHTLGCEPDIAPIGVTVGDAACERGPWTHLVYYGETWALGN